MRLTEKKLSVRERCARCPVVTAVYKPLSTRSERRLSVWQSSREETSVQAKRTPGEGVRAQGIPSDWPVGGQQP